MVQQSPHSRLLRAFALLIIFYIYSAGTALADDALRHALFVNASTSANKTSIVRLVNLTTQSGTLTATAYNEAGTQVGTPHAALGSFAARQMLSFTSAQLEAALGYVPTSGSAKYRIAFNSSLPSFELLNFIRDNASGNLTAAQAQSGNPAASSAAASSRHALFVNPSSSANKTSVIRVINLTSQGGTLRATAYNEAGTIVGTADAALGAIAARQMLSFTSAQLEAAIGYVPTSGTAKYRIVFSATLPGFELLNFIKDNAGGNLTLGQAQTDNRAASSAGTSSRHALYVNASTAPKKTSVLRLVNPGHQAGSLSATAYDEAGTIVGTANASLGAIAAQQMLGFTSAQLEAALGYTPASANAKYRIVFSATLPSFELLNFIKENASGNLSLAQEQLDDSAAGTAAVSSRHALLVHASTSSSKTSIVRLINLNSQAGAFTATAYDEAGTIVGTANAPLGVIAAQQTRSFTSAQLEAALGYTPASGSAKYHIVFNADLPGFEIVAFSKKVTQVNFSATPSNTSAPAVITLVATATDTENNIARVLQNSPANGR